MDELASLSQTYQSRAQGSQHRANLGVIFALAHCPRRRGMVGHGLICLCHAWESTACTDVSMLLCPLDLSAYWSLSGGGSSWMMLPHIQACGYVLPLTYQICIHLRIAMVAGIYSKTLRWLKPSQRINIRMHTGYDQQDSSDLMIVRSNSLTCFFF